MNQLAKYLKDDKVLTVNYVDGTNILITEKENHSTNTVLTKLLQ